MTRQQLSPDAPSDTTAIIDRVRALFDAQTAHRWTKARTTARERAERLRRLRATILDRKDELCEAIHADLRKHPTEVELTELQPVLGELNHTIKHLGGWMRPRRVPSPLTLFGTRGEVRYEPKGVVLIQGPWNYPFNLMINPLVAAIAAGNCAILKPSEKTPNTSRFIASLVESVFEPREVTVVEGDADVARALLDLPFDHIFFTGSPRVGQYVMEAAARHLTPVTLELGGKSPVIVDEAADVEQAARRIVWGKLINAGQTCVAPDYALVAESRKAEFVASAKRAIAASYGETEASRKQSADLCRLVDRASYERLTGLLRDAVERGATVEIGGEGDADERYLAPTILTDVDPASDLMREEIFGPILPVLTYRSLDDAIRAINGRAKPLALYVFSNRTATIDRVIAETTAGGTAINNVVLHLANPDLPFGGVGASGMGNYHGEFGFRTFSHERAVLTQGRLSFFQYLYPPYTDRVRGLVARITSWLF